MLMATLESPQIEVLINSVADKDKFYTCNKKKKIQMEQTSLLETSRSAVRRIRLNYRRYCLRSKASLLILFWNLLISLILAPLDTGYYFNLLDRFLFDLNQHTAATLFFGFVAIFYLFYPLAGYLADVKCGRYKAVLYGIWFIFWSGIFVMAGTIIWSCYTNGLILSEKRATNIILAVGFGPPVVLGMIILLCSYTAVSANILQFGMDQLYDSSTEDHVIFIHWFVFTSCLGLAVNKIVATAVLANTDFYTPIYVITENIPIAALLIVFGLSLVIAYYKRHWFLIDFGSRNPYKLVYKVIKFAAQHKSPIRRSAFTYCEDELPSRMDLAKDKYGGPFTTEQVEDVKAFLGMLHILLALGPVFATEIAVSNTLSRFASHLHFTFIINNHSYKFNKVFFLNMFALGGLSDVLIVILVPVYLCLLRPLIQHYIPGMLKRIGLGMALLLLSSLSVLLIDTIGHLQDSNNTCFLTNGTAIVSLHISTLYLIFPYILNALGYMLFYIATYEFICAQSPYAMKGLLIGTFFTVKGVFHLISATVLFIPFTWWGFETSFPSCGFVYYLVNIVVAVIGLVAYSWVARRYQYRQRDEPDNIYRYAEEYYDRAHEEHLQNSYDSSDFDNINVHTVS